MIEKWIESEGPKPDYKLLCVRLSDELDHLRARNAELEEQINNPKMTYCAFCGEKYDIQDREKAIELITAHVYTCEKHPVYLYSKRNAEIEEKNTKLINDFNDMVEEHGFDQFEILVLKTDIEVLVKRNAALEAETSKLRQAIGLATTCAPKMVMNVADPIGMMQTVCAEFKELHDEIARLRKALEKIDVLCSDRKRIVMIGIQAFGTVSQITKAALEASDG